MSKRFSKPIAILLVFIMVLGMLPVIAFAATGNAMVYAHVMRDAKTGRLIQFKIEDLRESIDSDGKLFEYYNTLEGPVAFVFAEEGEGGKAVEGTEQYVDPETVQNTFANAKNQPGATPTSALAAALEVRAVPETVKNEPIFTVAPDEEGSFEEITEESEPDGFVTEEGTAVPDIEAVYISSITAALEDGYINASARIANAEAGAAAVFTLLDAQDNSVGAPVTDEIAEGAAEASFAAPTEAGLYYVEVKVGEVSRRSGSVEIEEIIEETDAELAVLAVETAGFAAITVENAADAADIIAAVEADADAQAAAILADFDGTFTVEWTTGSDEIDTEATEDYTIASTFTVAVIDADENEAECTVTADVNVTVDEEETGIVIESAEFTAANILTVTLSGTPAVTLSNTDFAVSFNGTNMTNITAEAAGPATYILRKASAYTAGAYIITGKNNISGANTISFHTMSIGGTVTADVDNTYVAGLLSAAEAAVLGTTVTIKDASTLDTVAVRTLDKTGVYYFNLEAGVYNVYVSKEGYKDEIKYGVTLNTGNLTGTHSPALKSVSTDITIDASVGDIDGDIINVISGKTASELLGALELLFGAKDATNIVVQTSATNQTPVGASSAVADGNVVFVKSSSGTATKTYTIATVSGDALLGIQLEKLTLKNGTAVDTVALDGWQSGMSYRVAEKSINTASSADIPVLMNETLTVFLTADPATKKVFSEAEVAAAMAQAPAPTQTINYAAETLPLLQAHEYNTESETAETWLPAPTQPLKVLPDTTYYVRVKSLGENKTSGKVQTIVSGSRPAAPTGLMLEKDTLNEQKVAIVGTTAAMEYMIDSNPTGNPCAANITRNVAAFAGGTVHVRYAATSSTFASHALSLPVSANHVSGTFLGNATYTVVNTPTDGGSGGGNIHYNSISNIISIDLVPYSTGDFENFDKIAAVVSALSATDEITIASGEVSAVEFKGYGSIGADKTVNLGTNIAPDATLVFDTGTNTSYTLTVKGTTNGVITIGKDSTSRTAKIDVSDTNLTGAVVFAYTGHTITLTAGTKAVTLDSASTTLNLVSAGGITLTDATALNIIGNVVLTKPSSITANGKPFNVKAGGSLTINTTFDATVPTTAVPVIGEATGAATITVGANGELKTHDNWSYAQIADTGDNKLVVNAGGVFIDGASKIVGKDATALMSLSSGNIAITRGGSAYNFTVNGDMKIENTVTPPGDFFNIASGTTTFGNSGSLTSFTGKLMTSGTGTIVGLNGTTSPAAVKDDTSGVTTYFAALSSTGAIEDIGNPTTNKTLILRTNLSGALTLAQSGAGRITVTSEPGVVITKGITINRNNVTLSGLTMNVSGTTDGVAAKGSTDYTAVLVEAGKTGVSIQNCDIKMSLTDNSKSATGVYVKGGTGSVSISGCTIESNHINATPRAYAVYVWERAISLTNSHLTSNYLPFLYDFPGVYDTSKIDITDSCSLTVTDTGATPVAARINTSSIPNNGNDGMLIANNFGAYNSTFITHSDNADMATLIKLLLSISNKPVRLGSWTTANTGTPSYAVSEEYTGGITGITSVKWMCPTGGEYIAHGTEHTH